MDANYLVVQKLGRVNEEVSKGVSGSKRGG
jgi:hypothetical protein